MPRTRSAAASLPAVAGRLQTLKTVQVPVLLAGAALALATFGATGSPRTQSTVTTTLVLMVAVVGFYIFVGNSGVFSFGHAAFMAIGAYVAPLLVIDPLRKPLLIPGLPEWVADLRVGPDAATLIAGIVAATVAAVVSVPLMRLAGIAASLASFALLGIVHTVAIQWEELTNGPAGLVGIPHTTNLWTATGWAIAAIGVAWLFQMSSVCQRLRASREDELAARAIGIGVHAERRYAFCVSAFFMGAAGSLYAQHLGTVTPSTVYLDVTFLLVVMLVVGGTGSLSGAVLGTAVVAALAETLRSVEAGISIGGLLLDGPLGTREVGLAVALLVVLAFKPVGLCAKEIRLWR